MGLDYDAVHLAIDAKKLINSKPRHGYLIHLVRDYPKEQSAERIILELEAKTGIRTAYGRITGWQKAYKLVNDRQITEESKSAQEQNNSG
jgi:hypothetical protein